ncbi:MAG: DUF456 domain-containing protein [Bacteroidaceae bacterium]|jgi:uncharacterized protein YqgC (DUF456 family)|nr:DUF456 domain-containing protein [Bacteroidaceae bacterium]
METLFLILAILFALVGLAGAVLPVLPGPPLSYVALWLMWLYDRSVVSLTTLVLAGVFMIVITVLDYVAPIWFTKKGKGTKAGIRGATIGMIIGLFFLPLGLIVGPFVGALIGELLVKTPFEAAIKVAFMSFLAFLMTTALKLVYGAVIVGMLVAMFVR